MFAFLKTIVSPNNIHSHTMPDSTVLNETMNQTDEIFITLHGNKKLRVWFFRQMRM